MLITVVIFVSQLVSSKNPKSVANLRAVETPKSVASVEAFM